MTWAVVAFAVLIALPMFGVPDEFVIAGFFAAMSAIGLWFALWPEAVRDVALRSLQSPHAWNEQSRAILLQDGMLAQLRVWGWIFAVGAGAAFGFVLWFAVAPLVQK